MAKEFVDLRLSQQVDGLTQECVTYTPPAGSEVGVKLFSGEGTGQPNAAALLIWKFQHATETEEILWSTKFSSSASQAIRILDAGETDGVRDIALCLDNGEVGDLYMSCYVRLVVVT